MSLMRALILPSQFFFRNDPHLEPVAIHTMPLGIRHLPALRAESVCLMVLNLVEPIRLPNVAWSAPSSAMRASIFLVPVQKHLARLRRFSLSLS